MVVVPLPTKTVLVPTVEDVVREAVTVVMTGGTGNLEEQYD